MKQIRLDHEAYEQGTPFSVTIATARRQQLFTNAELVQSCLQSLGVAAKRYRATVFAYCFMPDHLHLLLSLPEGSNLITFIRHFKQLTSYGFRKKAGGQGGFLWQRRFYDHALRRGEDLEVLTAYILGNPVRAGLVEEPNQYPHAGSLSWNLSGSEDPDLRDRDPPRAGAIVGEGLQTLAAAGS